MVEYLLTYYVVVGLRPVPVTKTSDIETVSSKEFLDKQANIECGHTLKCVRDMIITYSQIYRTDKLSRHSSIIWSVWPNSWMFGYELSGCRFESSCGHWNFIYRTCFEQGVPWYLGKYRVCIHSEMLTWHNNDIESNVLLKKVVITQLNHLVNWGKWLSVRLQTKWL